jgi:hypothetical protein
MKQLVTVAVGVGVCTVLAVAASVAPDPDPRPAAAPVAILSTIPVSVDTPAPEMSLREHHRVTRSKTREPVKPFPVKRLKAKAYKAVKFTRSGREMPMHTAKNRVLGHAMAADKGWTGEQWYCLEDLWSHESQWSTSSGHPSRAYGIPQSLPGGKMASEGARWMTDAKTQIKWGLKYIKGRWGTPCGAWAHFQAVNWY